jgi:hypothetical protein
VSRPPSPHPTESTGRDQNGDLNRLDYLPLEYADLLALEEELAVTRLRRPRPESSYTAEEADVARTFMEMSAVVGHVLSVYQRYHAGEAFISTAQAPSSLVRHAHRLAYDPDPGLAASGHVVLFTKDGVGGTVAAGLALASVPLGEAKAQDYETRDEVVVDAALNEIAPIDARKPVVIPDAGTTTIRLQGVGHGLEPGDRVALIGSTWEAFVVEDAVEHEPDATTIVTLDSSAASASVGPITRDHPPILLAHPALAMRPFGADADPAIFPPSALKAATGTKPTTGPYPRFWYTVQRGDEGYDAHDVYLSEKVDEPLTNEYALRSAVTGSGVFKVTAEAEVAVTINREAKEPFTTATVKLVKEGTGFKTKRDEVTIEPVVRSHRSGTVTAIRAEDAHDVSIVRTTQPIPAEWLARWAVEAPLAVDEPNHSPVGESLDLPGLLPALAPGRPLVFSNLAGTHAQIVTISRAALDEAEGVTTIWWDPVTSEPEDGWLLDDLKIFGNVARVAHGRTVEETLGGSDGVSPFQRFELGESPVTVLPGVAGGEPVLEARVDDVLWQRVVDFADSLPDDRHYRIATDEELVTSVVFGDGLNGAVPPSGRKNITAVYRVGLGRAGNVEARRLTRLKRAHPLLDHAVNVTIVSGGAEPADARSIRAQSTRWIRTFDRAVSVSDVADLALTMPGIARAAARWDQVRGIVLVVATADGLPPPAREAIRAFLDARRDITVSLALDDPAPRAVHIKVNVEPDPAYHVEVVKDSLRAALHGVAEDAPGMFTFPARDLGQPAFLSEVYARLEAVPGVIGVRIDQFQAGDGAQLVAEVIVADVDQWLSLAPTDLTVTAYSPGVPA